MYINNLYIYNICNAIRGMRNPLNSWHRIDSFETIENNRIKTVIGKNDLTLMRKLFLAGSEHRKYLRQIFVTVDITAPLYWWKEFDTYKIGTVANSTSTMHKMCAKPIEVADFECSNLSIEGKKIFELYLKHLEELRLEYLNTKDKNTWYEIIKLLPNSYLQTRTVTMNYENVFSMLNQRKHHKLDEWIIFCEFMKTNCPMVREFIDNIEVDTIEYTQDMIDNRLVE